MAFSGQDAQKVWKKVSMALTGSNQNPAMHIASILAFKGLKEALATQYGNAQLQFLPFSEDDADTAGGTVLLSGACKVYAVFVRKVSAATDNYVKVYDDATDDTTAGDQIIAIPLLATQEEAFEIHPNGLAFATGIVITQHTTSIGVTDGSDGGNGFIIIGAA